MTVFILPHPDTRECPRHHGELEHPGRPCLICEKERLLECFAASLRAAISGGTENTDV